MPYDNMGERYDLPTVGERQGNKFFSYCKWHNLFNEYACIENYLLNTDNTNDDIIEFCSEYFSNHPAFHGSNSNFKVEDADDADYVADIVYHAFDVEIGEHNFPSPYEVWAEEEDSKRFEMMR